jgi:Mn-dependent DtxR family transcriptional regulator
MKSIRDGYGKEALNITSHISEKTEQAIKGFLKREQRQRHLFNQSLDLRLVAIL